MTLSFLRILFSFFLVFAFAIPRGMAQNFRERLKQRIQKKLESRPAPEANIQATEKITKAGDYTLHIKHGDHTRMYKIHVPKSYKTETATAVLFAFHGGGGDMNHQANDSLYNQISKSNQEGYIVVFPNGYSPYKSGKLATWNAGKCCGDARDLKIDDVGFVKEIIKNLEHQLNIDKSKIFASGMSNGGMMSYRLACEMSDVFKGIAAVAGTDNTIDCSPKNPISILHIHAKDDTHVLFNGGAGKKAFKDLSKVTDFNSVPNTMKKWVKHNACDAKPKRVLEKEGAYCDLYSKCKNGVEVQLCVTDTGGHSWPGGKKPRSDEKPSYAISANDVIWDFFKGKL